MKIKYLENGDLALFDGRKYRRDKNTGYYLNSNTRTRLHRAVWIYNNGEIPDGFHIHHMDEDKSNNEIENLQLIKAFNHQSLHATERAVTHREEILNNLITKAVPKSKAWHKSAEGLAWHSKHALETIANLELKEFNCQHCGKAFFKKPLGQNKFCSNNCKSANRRKRGVDNETRKCIYCGKQYETNKYSNRKYCTRKCASLFCRHKGNSIYGQTGRVQYGSQSLS